MKLSPFSVLRLLLLTLTLVVSARATTLYVDTTGSDSAAGTSTAPLATLSRALALVKAGDTISLGTGTFGGDANTSVAGTVTSPITIQGAGVGSTIYTGSLVVDTNYYIIRKITFNGESVTFSNATACILEDSEAHGGLNNLKIEGGSNCIVRRNLFSRPGANGMVNVSGTGHLLEGNTYRKNNGFDANRTNGAVACIWRGNVFESLGTPNNNVTTSASSNTIDYGRKTFIVGSGMGYEPEEFMRIESSVNTANYLRARVVSYSGTSLVVDVRSIAGSGTIASWNVRTEGEGNHADLLQSWTWDNYDCIFERNRVNNCDTQLGNFEANPDLAVGQVRDWTFRNNIFYNSRIQINIYAPGFKFYNNTVYNTAGTTGFRGATGTKGNGVPLKVYNNIFCRVGSIESGGPYSGASADYNLITDYADDSPKTGYSEAHGINGGYTPSQIFVDPANGDLRLKSGSPAVGAGGNLATILGLVGLTATKWDMGASDALITSGSPDLLPAPSNARISSTP